MIVIRGKCTVGMTGVIKIVIVIICNFITFPKVIARNCNSGVSLIAIIECI